MLNSKAIELIRKTCKGRQNIKLTVGYLESGEKTVKVFGESGEIENGNYIYDTGSITKTFTAMLLAKFVQEGRMSLDDSIQKYIEGLDAGRTYPTLRRLATHTSGYSANAPLNGREVLKLFTDMALGRNQGAIPFQVDWETVKAVLQKRELRDQDYKWAYSNFGYMLIGHAIGVVSGQGYRDTMDEFISMELGLGNTYTGTYGDKNLHGFTKRNEDCGNWQYEKDNLISGAGCVSSTADDLLTYADINIHEKKPYIPLCHQKHADASKRYDMGLGWWLHKGSNHVMEHEGGTGAFGGFLVFDKNKQTAAVVLANYKLGLTSEKDIGLSVLRGL